MSKELKDLMVSRDTIAAIVNLFAARERGAEAAAKDHALQAVATGPDADRAEHEQRAREYVFEARAWRQATDLLTLKVNEALVEVKK